MYPYKEISNGVVEIVCHRCKEVTQINVGTPGLARISEGMSVQKAIPNVSASLREMFISGTCSACFDAIFGCVCEYEETYPEGYDESSCVCSGEDNGLDF